MLIAKLLLAFFCAATATVAFEVSKVDFDDVYRQTFGGDNLVRLPDDRSLSLSMSLKRHSGSGFISLDSYQHGLFSAKIKLPSDYTAGVVVAFYVSNGDVFDKTHDELDFEFLGNIRGRPWKVQTNVYGNGSLHRGREERYLLPFDPTKEAHRYSILWTAETIIFYIDDMPIRVVRRSDAMGADYPSKPMFAYATIWDGSTWATEGGRYKADYRHSPFTTDLSEVVLRGCRADAIQQPSAAALCADAEAELLSDDFAVITPDKRAAMLRFRERYMLYSFCYDMLRYPITFPDCDVIPSEQQRFKETGNSKFISTARRRRRSKRRTTNLSVSADPSLPDVSGI